MNKNSLISLNFNLYKFRKYIVLEDLEGNNRNIIYNFRKCHINKVDYIEISTENFPFGKIG